MGVFLNRLCELSSRVIRCRDVQKIWPVGTDVLPFAANCAQKRHFVSSVVRKRSRIKLLT